MANPSSKLPIYSVPPERAGPLGTNAPAPTLDREREAYNRDRGTLMAIDGPIERARFFMRSYCCPAAQRGDLVALLFWLREYEGLTQEEVAALRHTIVAAMRARDGDAD